MIELEPSDVIFTVGVYKLYSYAYMDVSAYVDMSYVCWCVCVCLYG